MAAIIIVVLALYMFRRCRERFGYAKEIGTEYSPKQVIDSYDY